MYAQTEIRFSLLIFWQAALMVFEAYPGRVAGVALRGCPCQSALVPQTAPSCAAVFLVANDHGDKHGLS